MSQTANDVTKRAVFTTRPVIQGRFGVVSSGHYLASEIALRVLNAGGNAVDAGVAGVFALTVLKPQSCGIGGESPILLWRPEADTSRDRHPLPNPLAINGQGSAPRAATIDWFRSAGLDMIPGDGLLAPTVPATFDACVEALRVGGRLGLVESLEPAVELAREGFALYPSLREQLVRHQHKYAETWPSTGAVWLDDGRVPEVGSWIRQPEWAATFQRVLDAAVQARGDGREAELRAARDAYYRGPIATRLAEFAQTTELRDATGRANRGLLAEEDFAGYRTRLEAAVSIRYAGLDVYKCDSWTQGPVFLQQLRLLEGFDLPALGHNSPEYIHLVVEASKLAFADRERWYGDREFASVPMERLLSPEYAAERRRLIDTGAASGEMRPGDAEARLAESVGGGPALTAGDTTHIDVVDAEGRMFAATPSGGWLESSPVVPGLGFPLGSRLQVFNLDPSHPNSLAPGKRPRTTLTPSLVARGGQPHMVFGTPGGDQQDQHTLQFFLNVVEFGMDLQAAMDAPLFHTTHFPSSFYPHEAFPKRVVVEGRVPDATVDALRGLGHEVVVAGDWELGQVNAVRFDPETGRIEGAASPRSMIAYAVGR